MSVWGPEISGSDVFTPNLTTLCGQAAEKHPQSSNVANAIIHYGDGIKAWKVTSDQSVLFPTVFRWMFMGVVETTKKRLLSGHKAQIESVLQ